MVIRHLNQRRFGLFQHSRRWKTIIPGKYDDPPERGRGYRAGYLIVTELNTAGELNMARIAAYAKKILKIAAMCILAIFLVLVLTAAAARLFYLA
jgi:hypothetical protein